jgi:hypothetical protein
MTRPPVLRREMRFPHLHQPGTARRLRASVCLTSARQRMDEIRLGMFATWVKT